MTEQTLLWRLSLEISDEHVPSFEVVLEPFVESLMWTVDEDAHGQQHMEGFTTDQPNVVVIETALARQADILGILPPTLVCEKLAPKDWVAENLKDFPPIDAGRFYIYASHIDERPLPGRIPMRIDPGAAFGTGTHATTSGCLDALEKLGNRYDFLRPLDVGCGSGILAIAMAKLWHVHILGTDIDMTAVAVAKRNAHLNRVVNLLTFKAGPGFSPIAKHEKFDLIVANILARPLVNMARDLSCHIEHNGFVVLSGLLERDERFVVGAYRGQGLYLKSRHVRDDWLTLVMRKG